MHNEVGTCAEILPNKVLSRPFRITETSNCRRRGHLCRFHKKIVDRVAYTMAFSLHSERWNVC